MNEYIALDQKKLDISKYHFVGIWRRLCALILDLSFLMLLIILVIKLVWSGFGLQNELTQATGIIIYTSAAVYTVALPSSPFQATFGMLLCGIKIIDLYGKRISFFRSLTRFITLQVPSVVLGAILVELLGFSNYVATACVMVPFVCIAFDRDKRWFHDMICGTYVIYNK